MIPLLTALVLLQAPSTGPWERISERDGLTLEVQAVPGSGFENVRVTCTTSATPQAFIRALWGHAQDTTPSPEVVRRDVLIDEATVRRYYDVVHPPPASDRDYVMHETWDEVAGVTALHFESVADPARPVSKELVRFGKVAGSFSAAPKPDGGSTLTYLIFTDLGGSIPAWLTRGAQRDAAKKFVLEIRRRAEKPESKK